MYHYETCGLDNVWLCNGYEIREYGNQKSVAIHDIDGLHRAIVKQLIEKPAPLSGAEFRFLRVEMDLSQSMLSTLLGVTDQAIAKWEKGQTKKPPAAADRLMRALASERVLNASGSVSEIVELLAKIDRQIIERLEFEETSQGWMGHPRAA